MPEDNNLNIHCHEHLKSHISLGSRPLKKPGAIFVNVKGTLAAETEFT